MRFSVVLNFRSFYVYSGRTKCIAEEGVVYTIAIGRSNARNLLQITYVSNSHFYCVLLPGRRWNFSFQCARRTAGTCDCDLLYKIHRKSCYKWDFNRTFRGRSNNNVILWSLLEKWPACKVIIYKKNGK